MEGIVLPNSPEKLIKTAVSTKASATPAENVPNGSTTNSSKSDAVAEQMTGRSASQNGKPGIHFPIGILKECEVQVQAFLEDADSVLAALDQCQAEEKCLMLIKRPKDSARKMLKSHSWANLSVSDPQLYRQFNGIQLAQVHHPGLTTFHKAKRSSDEQSVTSTDTDRSEPRRRYVSARGKENVKQPPHPVRALPDPGNQSSDYYLSDSSSVASDYQYVPRRERDRERDAGRRADLRYSSIPEDAQEINNNNSNKAAMYHSCHDVSLAAQAGGAGRPDWGRQGQGQGHQGQGHPGQGQGPIPSDRMYGSRGGPDCGGGPPTTHDPGDMMEDGVRSQSLGNLSTGLTLSLVGQRKADSMLDLSSSTAPSSSSSAARPQPQPQPHHYHPPPRTHAPRPRRSEAAGYLDDIFTSPDGCVRSPRHSYPEGVRSPRSREGSETFSPPPPPPHRDSNGYHNYNDVRSPPPHQQQYHHHSNHYQHQQQQQKHPNNYYHHPNYANTPVSGGQRGQQQHNGYAYASGGSGSTSGEQTPQSDGAPPKPKRSLPNVPLNETSERIKRFTEMMRSRMSVCSSADRSTTSSQTPTTPHTPLSRQASITENGSDCEVSTLLDVRLKNASEGNGGGGGRAPHPQQDARAKEGWGGEGRGKGGQHHPPYPARPPPPSSSQETPQPYGDPLGESGHTPFTSHSHSSTMDSGYTTNTEGDGDSTTNTSHHQLSPPHHHSHQHQHHHPTAGQHPQQPQPHPHPHPHHHHHHHHHHHPGQQQSNPGHAAQPQQAGAAAAAELPRPVPVPRNLSLASARKFSSMQNVSSVHGQQQQPAYPSAPHPGEWGGAAARNPPGPQPRGPGPGPVRAQHSLNGADYPAAVAVMEHQRRSWDLAHNFKSLDFMPVADGAAQARGGPLAREDHVVKPQAVSVKAGGSGSGTLGAERASPRRSDGQQRREGPESGQGKRGSWQEPRTPQNPAPPASSPPSPPPEANGINTLPGHWKYNNANNGNVVNNNNSSSTVNNAVVSNRNLHNTDAPKTHPKPNNDATTTTNTTTTTCTTAATTTTPSLTLFQLSQCYDLCSVKLTLPGSLSAGSTVTLSSLQVTLPALALDSSSAPVHSPQGRCARLGGPGSAFRPVRTGAGAGGQTTVSLTGVESADKQCQELCTLGELRTGDVVVEVNGRHCLGWELTSVQHLLDNAQGEVMLGIARKKDEQIDNRVQQLESSLKKLEMEVQRLNEEMSKKDARILELSTMLPWKRDEETGGDKVILESEEGAFVIGDNEFVV